MANENIIELTEDNFQSVLEEGQPLLVDFWAEWCGPCRMVAPTLDQLASEYDGKVRIGKLNVDQNQALSMQYQVQSIPTFLMFKDGEVIGRMMGAMPKAAFEKFIDKNLESAQAAPATADVAAG